MKKGVIVHFVSFVIGVTLGLLSPVAYGGRAIDLVEPAKVLINCELGAEQMDYSRWCGKEVVPSLSRPRSR